MLAVPDGGTGQSTLTNHGVLVGATTSAITQLAAGTAGQVLQSGGASADPAYSTATYPVTAGTTGNVLTSNGTNFSSSAPAASSLVTILNAGSGNWSANAKTTYVKVYIWSGGSGGGSGRKGATTAAGGGGGGSAGAFGTIEGPVAFFTGSIPYVVGASAAGGIAQSSDGVNGNPGTVGNLSSFGSMTIPGGTVLGGTGGTTTNAASDGARKNQFLIMAASVPVSPNGGTGNNITPGAAQTAGGTSANALGYMNATGGGGGSGGDTGTARQAAAGGNVIDVNSSVILAGGAGGIASGTIAGSNGNPPSSTIGIMSGGTGGGGGGGAFAAGGGKGGDGALPGGGGGGGGGGISTQGNSGAGGIGAAGQIIIIESF